MDCNNYSMVGWLEIWQKEEPKTNCCCVTQRGAWTLISAPSKKHMIPLSLVPGIQTQALCWWHHEVHHCANDVGTRHPSNFVSIPLYACVLSVYSLVLYTSCFSCIPFALWVPAARLNFRNKMKVPPNGRVGHDGGTSHWWTRRRHNLEGSYPQDEWWAFVMAIVRLSPGKPTMVPLGGGVPRSAGGAILGSNSNRRPGLSRASW